MGPTGGDEGPVTKSFGRWDWLYAAAIVIAVFVVYWPAIPGQMIFDDDVSVMNDPVVRPKTLPRIWVPGVCDRYWPVTFTLSRIQL